MPAPLSAVDAISPAMERTLTLLLRPFRWSFWWRMAVIAFLTGELGGGNFNVPSDLGPRSRGGNDFLAPAVNWAEYMPLIIAAVAVVIVVSLIFMYIGSVFRFVLLDAVLTGRYRLREGWDRWQAHGGRLFRWLLLYSVVVLAIVGFIVLLIAGSVSGMKTGRGAASVLVLVFSVLAILALVVVALVVWSLTKDFVLPIMAFEGVKVGAAWGRLWEMMKAEPMNYAGFIGMKLLLVIGASVAVGIIGIILLLIILIPVVLVVAMVVAGLSLKWNPFTILLAVVLGGIFLLFLFFLMSLLAVPVAIFFVAYALQFFGRRFAPLAAVMYPEPPPPPVPLTPEPPPEPAPA